MKWEHMFLNKLLCLLVCIVTFIVISGCASTPPAVGYTENSERFQIAVSEGNNAIYIDRYTGVMYFFHRSGNSGGMSVMLDADGKPLVWDNSIN